MRVALLFTTLAAIASCLGAPSEGEGEGPSEGEGVAGEGEGGAEGEGAAAGEGEGAAGEGEGGAGEGEGAAGEGEGAAGGEGEGEGEGDPTVQVTFDTGCWELDNGQRFQAMPFDLTTEQQVPLEGTLFFNTHCDPVDGTDNLNDTGATLLSGGWLFWFIHHPDERQTSAIWSIGGHESICVDYSTAPDC